MVQVFHDAMPVEAFLVNTGTHPGTAAHPFACPFAAHTSLLAVTEITDQLLSNRGAVESVADAARTCGIAMDRKNPVTRPKASHLEGRRSLKKVSFLIRLLLTWSSMCRLPR